MHIYNFNKCEKCDGDLEVVLQSINKKLADNV